MKKLYLTLMFGIMLIGLVSSASIGVFKQSETIELTNYCSTADCTYANISSITYPNGSIETLNLAMTKTNNDFNYTFSNTSQIGSYSFVTCSNPGGTPVCDKDSFEITPTGYSTTTGSSIIYGGLLFVLLLIDFFFIYVITGLELGNYRDEVTNEVIGISLKKYLKISMIGISYGLVILTLNLMNSLALSIQQISQFSGILGGIFTIMIQLAWPWTIAIIIWIFLAILQDSKFRKEIENRFSEAQYS